MDAPDTRPECQIPEGPLTWGTLARLGNCRLPKGELTIDVPSEIHDKHGHELDGDHDPAGAHGCDHRDTPEWKTEHRAKHAVGTPKMATPMEDNTEPDNMSEKTAIIVNEAPVSPETTSITQIPAPPVTTATVGVDAAVGQIKSLLPAGADASPGLLIGGAAGLAVVGAAVKFGPGLLKARAERLAQEKERDHEERMKKLEIEEKKAEKSEEQHGQCNASRLALEARVAAAEQKSATLEARLIEVAAKAEKAVSSAPSFDADFDPNDLEERLKRLEKTLKSAGKPVKKKR